MIAGVAWFNAQIVFSGIIEGLAIGLIAVGIVLVYRATFVINFAVGAIGLIGTSVLSLMVLQYHVPFWISLVVSLLVGMLFGGLIEVGIIRRLRAVPVVIVLVATIGIAQLAQAIVTAIPLPGDATAHFPTAISGSWSIGDVSVSGSDLFILISVPVVVLALSWFLGHTLVGKAVKASASNPELARMSGINPKLISTLVWVVAAGLSTLSIILIAGLSGSATSLTTLGPDTLALALAAAVMGGMRSFWKSMVAGIVIGVTQSMIQFNFLTEPGLIDAVLLVAVLVAVWFYSREAPVGGQAFSFTPKTRPIPDRLRTVWWTRHLDKSGLVILGIFAVILPLVVTVPSRQQLYTVILAYAICASSLTVLTGWSGQVSLGQMAFAGLGALFAARLVYGGVPFWVTIPITSVVAAAFAGVIGVGSLRVRGLLLAVMTFAFALAAQQYFYPLPILSGQSVDGANVAFVPGHLFGIAFEGQRSYYYVVLFVLAVVIAVLSRLRKSGIGRSTIAVRDNLNAAAAYTVSPLWTKIRAFALAGALAGLGGTLLAGAFQNVAFTQNFFLVNDSQVLIAIVVIGGLGSITGPILGALWVIGIPALAPGNQIVSLLASGLGLLFLLLYFPRGLNQISFNLRDAIFSWAEKRLAHVAPAPRAPASGVIRTSRVAEKLPLGPSLSVTDLRVQFGGNIAVGGVSLALDHDEIVGIIGANGAGKSTLMNAIGGFVPSTGSVRLFGSEVGTYSANRRAGAGLGRTFQSATLFPELTVRETVQVALEARERTGFLSTALFLPRSSRRERAKRAQAGELLDFLGLGPYGDHHISDLSTGTRRIVEMAGLLALDAKVLCLDEPTAGVAQRETEAFGPLIVEVRRELGASMLIIEHDMPLIMNVSDRVYCLELGTVIASGSPNHVRNDQRVIASYLGTDERAIARSGSV